MPANVSAPQTSGLLPGVMGAGSPARKGEASTNDSGFAALLAMLVGQGLPLPQPFQIPPEMAGEGAEGAGGDLTGLLQRIAVAGKLSEGDLTALLTGAGVPAENVETMVAALSAAENPSGPEAQHASVPVQGTSLFANTEREEELPSPEAVPTDLPVELTAAPLLMQASTPAPAPSAVPVPAAGQKAELPEPLRRLTEVPIPSDRLLKTIAEATTKVRPGEYTVTLKIHPQELGEVKLQLHLSGSQVQTVLEVAHPQVQRLVEAQSDSLRESLQQAGLTLSGFEVSTDQGGQSARDRQEQLEDLLRSQRRRPAEAPSVQPASAASLRRVGSPRSAGGRLDTTA